MLLKSLVLKKKKNNILFKPLFYNTYHCKDFTFDGLKIVILKAKQPNKIFYEN